jgi:hypothetical protein
MSPQRRHMTSSICLLLNVKPKKGFDFVLYSTNTYIYSKKNSLAGLSIIKMYGRTAFLNFRKGGVGASSHFGGVQVTTLPLLPSEKLNI